MKTKTIRIAARSAKRHRDCLYCGYGGPCTHVCGVCRQNGINGPVIRGTEAKKATTRTIKVKAK